ncbi:MAG TPA: proline dipeptidase [Firmicutes bacterium]|nr:proline dipeptidase [Bacillota bacterium]
MKKISDSLIIEKKSKFYGFMYELENENEVSVILNNLKSEHKKARHICYAYKIGVIERKNEDKEPSNTAGLPILEVIKRNNLDNTLIVVVRYFGGTLLGRGLLTRTYSKCACLLIKNK